MQVMQGGLGVGRATSTRVASLAPKHAVGQARHLLRVEAALTGTMMGTRLIPARVQSSRTQRSVNRRSTTVVVKAMWVMRALAC